MNKHKIKTLYITILVIIVMIFLVSLYVFYHHNKIKLQVSVITHDLQKNNLTNNIIETQKIEKKELQSEEKNNPITNNKTQKTNWIIKIPEINLNAEISEGTSKEIMDKYVGHFQDTQKEYGNVGLAAHNRGYKVNYFQDLKKLKIGSEIIYIHEDFEMTYIVEKIEIIENTNWDNLENTEDNRITLITCVENEPKYRRCIQGIEKVESEEY